MLSVVHIHVNFVIRKEKIDGVDRQSDIVSYREAPLLKINIVFWSYMYLMRKISLPGAGVVVVLIFFLLLLTPLALQFNVVVSSLSAIRWISFLKHFFLFSFSVALVTNKLENKKLVASWSFSFTVWCNQMGIVLAKFSSWQLLQGI